MKSTCQNFWRAAQFNASALQLRKLSKKYRSMLDDYDAFLTGLEQDPYQGTSLGKGVRKVRMAIARFTEVRGAMPEMI